MNDKGLKPLGIIFIICGSLMTVMDIGLYIRYPSGAGVAFFLLLIGGGMLFFGIMALREKKKTNDLLTGLSDMGYTETKSATDISVDSIHKKWVLFPDRYLSEGINNKSNFKPKIYNYSDLIRYECYYGKEEVTGIRSNTVTNGVSVGSFAFANSKTEGDFVKSIDGLRIVVFTKSGGREENNTIYFCGKTELGSPLYRRASSEMEKTRELLSEIRYGK